VGVKPMTYAVQSEHATSLLLSHGGNRPGGNFCCILTYMGKEKMQKVKLTLTLTQP